VRVLEHVENIDYIKLLVAALAHIKLWERFRGMVLLNFQEFEELFVSYG